MKDIFFDVDNVLRDLSGVIRQKFNLPQTTTWHNNEWDKLGKGVYELVAEDYDILTKAEPTKYLKSIIRYIKKKDVLLELWSHQPKFWQEPTMKWLDHYLKGIDFEILFLNSEQKYKRLKTYSKALLVEDYPHFPEYSQIVLIDCPYNKKVKADLRVKSVTELKEILNNNI